MRKLKKLIFLILLVTVIFLGCSPNRSSPNNLDISKIIINTEINNIAFIKAGQPAYIKRITDSEDVIKIIDKLEKVKLNEKLNEEYKGWVISLTLIGDKTQTILLLGDKIYIDSSWYSVDKSVIDEIEKLYEEINCNEEEYEPNKIKL